jgi:pimeloyl-ACP methyl ester carboxylesterase
MGRSGWREAYSMQQQAREALAVAEASGLFEALHPPILIGHSYGSFVARIVAQTSGARLGGIVLVDGALAASENDDEYDGVRRRGHRHRVYPMLAQALARFRFEPPQTCATGYIADHIAHTSLGEVRDEQGQPGWSWCFDPDLRAKTRALPTPELLAPPSCRTALMFGDRSLLMTRERLALLRSTAPAQTPWIVIPDSGHHIMVDQPLALVAALRALLAAWQPDATLHGDEPR